MSTVEWEDPPEDGRTNNRSVYQAFWIELKANPKRWARYPGGASSLSVMRKTHPEYEFVARTIAGEKVSFVRYIGANR